MSNDFHPCISLGKWTLLNIKNIVWWHRGSTPLASTPLITIEVDLM